MKYVFPACFYPEEDGRYSVDIPDLNISTYGENLPDAMYMASDAAAGRIVLLLDSGERLPKISNQTEITPDDTAGFVSMVFIDLDAYKAEYNDEPFETTLTIPAWLNTANITEMDELDKIMFIKAINKINNPDAISFEEALKASGVDFGDIYK